MQAQTPPLYDPLVRRNSPSTVHGGELIIGNAGGRLPPDVPPVPAGGYSKGLDGNAGGIGICGGIYGGEFVLINTGTFVMTNRGRPISIGGLITSGSGSASPNGSTKFGESL